MEENTRGVQGLRREELASIAEFYDHIGPYRDRQDIAFYVSEAEASGGPVLEVGCGTGRVLVPTASRGVPIVGIDSSKEMLEVCRERLADAGPEVSRHAELRAADMRAFELDRRFALTTIPFRPLQYLTKVEDQLICFRTLRRHCRSGGRLIFDVLAPRVDVLAKPLPEGQFGAEREFVMPDGRRVVRSHRIVGRDLQRQCFDAEFIYDIEWPDSRHEQLVEPYRMRWLWRYEIEHLLARCGWHLETVYGDFERGEPKEGMTNDQICVALAS